MHHNVGTVLERAAQIGGGDRVVHNQRHTVLVGNLGQLFKIGDVTQWVPHRLAVDGLGFTVNEFGKGSRVAIVGKAHLNTVLWQRVREQVVSATVQRRRGHDIVTGFGNRLDRVGYGRLTRSQCQISNTHYHGRHAFFQDILRRIHDARVDIAR